MANFNRKNSNNKKKNTNIFDTLEECNCGNTNFSVDSVRETEYGVFFNLILWDAVVIFGCRVVDTAKGAFIGMPSRKGGDRYYNYVGIMFSDELTKEILNAVWEKL